jgi:uncharacterized protein YvpB
MLTDKIFIMKRPRFVWVASMLLLFMVGLTQFASAESIPDSASISGVVGHPQSYSLSCEARSAVDWMAFWGVSASEADFLAQLPSSDNPDRGFVGKPNDIWGSIPPLSYGVHAEPVAALIRQYGVQAEAQRDLAWDDLRTEIAAGRPVIVWIIGQMWTATPRPYTDAEGHNTIVASFEHTMILTGYDATYVYVVDSFSGQNQVYGVQSFLNSWSVLGNMAVTGYYDEGEDAVNENQPAADTLPASLYTGTTYTVQRGDYLIALAERFGIFWQELAARNNIRYPYRIYPGQILEVPGSDSQPEETPPTQEPTPPPTLVPTPVPTAVPAVLKPEDIRFRLRLPEIYLHYQHRNPVVASRGRPMLRRGR